MASKRMEWLDTAKALSIILVVLGHAGHQYLDIYLGWFRIPLFFFLSGILFRPVCTRDFFRWAAGRMRRLMVPYFSYGILIFAVFNLHNMDMIFEHLAALLYGGRALQGPYGVFWFITVLLLTQMLLALMSPLKRWVQMTLITALFIIGHTPVLASSDFFWNVDTVLVAVLYYSLGHYAKDFIVKYNHSFWLAAGSALIAAFFVIMSANGFMAYEMNLKMGRLNNPVMDIIVPVSFFMPVIYLSTVLARCRARDALGTVGRYSVVIMYLHLPVNIFFRTVLGYDVTTFEFTCFGVVIPVIIGMLMSRAGVTRRLLLGRDNRMPKTAG
ncbi:MAG TPA: acyltransferase family protein [Candidatus Salinicoccus stercoripullorum]|uniref:Acyltransferase family protein n=1 Tax=Candidatus Salinicoccus stercoripullorum TaxID=2838756 RepID=A0A9D1QFZ5_9STAP|nr:acyltransferase family protein [Candidatus Salinicoccus stercoripullorum]